MKTRNGWKIIYSRWNGYPEYTGKTLEKYYNTPEKVKELIGLGNLSTIGKEIGKKHDFDRADKEHPNWTLAYGRDRGESDNNPKIVKTMKGIYNYASDTGAEYVYLFEKNKWKAYDAYDCKQCNVKEEPRLHFTKHYIEKRERMRV